MRTAWLITVVLTAGCADERALAGEVCPTWQAELAPALAAACAGCHGDAAPAGGYRLTSYLGALGGGTDAVANAIAGDATSALVSRVDPATADDAHAGQAALHAQLRRWVVDCELGYLDSTIHPRGVLDPTSAGFHGAELAAHGWDLARCASCHGGDFGGGAAGASCKRCHQRGPDACDTCHEAVPTTGAHTAHTASLACASCHRVPTAWSDDGHVRRGGAGDPAPAEVELTGLAAITVVAADRAGPPTFEAGTCRNVYCHGDVLGAAGGATTRPAWAVDPPGAASCGSCHGAPPPSHADDRCTSCHPTGVHVDGITQVGRPPGGCSGCHGGADSPAPPTDLAGNQFTTAIGVGAHQAHLRAPSQLGAPVACAACHEVPAEVTSPGHLDSTSPAEVTAALGWDRSVGTCAGAWCHGDARPRWTMTGEAACGTCHGIPPAGAPHTAAMTLTSCAACHASTIDAQGRIIAGANSTHVNGVTDVP